MNALWHRLGWRLPAGLVFLLLSLTLFVIVRSEYRLRPAPPPAIRKTFDGPWALALLQPAAIRGLEVDPVQEMVRAHGSRAYFTLRDFAEVGMPAVSHVRIDLRPARPFSYQDFLLTYTPASEASNGLIDPDYFIQNEIVRGVPTAFGEWVRVSWNLPQPIARARIEVPAWAGFRLVRIELVGPGDPASEVGVWSHKRTLGRLLLLGLAAALGLLAVQTVWRPVLGDSRPVKTVLLVGLAFAHAVMIFLLPPFQGPDEFRHWKEALARVRPDPLAEVTLYNLHEIIYEQPQTFDTFYDRNPLMFHSGNQLPAENLRADPGVRTPVPEPDRLTYTTAFTYPFVCLIGLVFPRVETVREALCFYYLCRLAPAVVLIGLLAWANRRGHLSYTALTFFSIPLVVQQTTIISSDTAGFLGTLLAAVLFLELQTSPAWSA